MNIKYCINCKKIISRQAIKCRSCARKDRKGKLSSNYKNGKYSKNYCCRNCGTKISLYRGLYGQKICKQCSIEINTKYCTDCKEEISKNAKRCKSCSKKYLYIVNPNKYKGKNNPAYKKGLPKCKNCGKQLVNYGSIYCIKCTRHDWMTNKKHKLITKKKMSNKQKGKLNSMYGKVTHAIHGRYKGTFMRSSYELNFARFLTLSGICWKYESKTFELGNTTYTPDFYLPESDCYIEIKGWWRDIAKRKLYPKTNIKIFREKKLKQLGVLN